LEIFRLHCERCARGIELRLAISGRFRIPKIQNLASFVHKLHLKQILM